MRIRVSPYVGLSTDAVAHPLGLDPKTPATSNDTLDPQRIS